MVELTKAGGPLPAQLKRQYDSAAAHGQLALVDVGAPWCAPCRSFERALSDPLMVSALRGVRLIHLDFDTWYSQLVRSGDLSTYSLPEFWLVTKDGTLGAHFQSSTRWQQHADSVHATTDAEMMGPPLQDFLAHARAQVVDADRTNHRRRAQ